MILINLNWERMGDGVWIRETTEIEDGLNTLLSSF